MDAPRRSFSNNLCFVLFCLLVFNIVTLSLFSSDSPFRRDSSRLLTISLSMAEDEIGRLRAELRAAKTVSEMLLKQMNQLTKLLSNETSLEQRDDRRLPKEYLEFVSAHELPFGFNKKFGSDKILAPAGRACDLFPDDLAKYMGYTIGGPCPDDEVLSQQLLLKGCEPLPRRRCLSPRQLPDKFVEPAPFPESLWSIPDDSSVVWTAYTCKNYGCLVNRRHQKGFDDCKDCFDLNYREKHRWLGRRSGEGALDFVIDEVLEYKKGTIRIGLDIGGGAGTFAVRMRERNVTIVTTSMNFNAPFNNFLASRGVVPFFITVSQRLPFFDGTLDIVHSMHVLSDWIPPKLFQFILYDIHRVLRPGGVFWLDHFFSSDDQLNNLYIPMIDALGFKKVRWSVGRKMDKGPASREAYLSALLEKPMTAS